MNRIRSLRKDGEEIARATAAIRESWSASSIAPTAAGDDGSIQPAIEAIRRDPVREDRTLVIDWRPEIFTGIQLRIRVSARSSMTVAGS